MTRKDEWTEGQRTNFDFMSSVDIVKQSPEKKMSMDVGTLLDNCSWFDK